MPKVAIIIVNWNGKADTLACLESLRADRHTNKHIVVVDNGSADDSVAAIRERHPELTLVEAGKNLGFTGGNNLGIRQALAAGCNYVYLLNNDTTVEPGALAELVATAEAQPRYGALTPVIYYYDRPNEVWFCGSKLDLQGGVAVHDNSSVPARTDPLVEIPWASGCAMLIPADVIRRLEGFDDRFFLNWEDVDLSLRIRRAGYRIGLVPSARIFHKVGRSMERTSGLGRYYYVRNNLLLLSIHGCGALVRPMFRVITTSLREEVRDWRAGRSPSCAMTLRAAWDHLQHAYGPIRN
jgi:GT2 family glycosyltransferase